MAYGVKTERLLVGTPHAFFETAGSVIVVAQKKLTMSADQNKPGEIWAIALSADGQYLASTSINGKINVWSLNKEEGMPRIREYETKGSFGLCVDLVSFTTLFLPLSITNTANVHLRVATAPSPRPATKMDRYTSSTMKPDVSPTP
jgi:WD40 repeat protein